MDVNKYEVMAALLDLECGNKNPCSFIMKLEIPFYY